MMLANLLLVLATAASASIGPSAVDLAPNQISYGLFGNLHLSRARGSIAHTVLFLSDRDGWSAREDRLATALADRGAFVVGIDLPAYLKRMEAIGDKCSYPAGHFEEVAHWIERREGFPTYSYPLVVGDGSGATFAYALTAQAPAGTFAGLITLGWDAAFRVPKPLCAGDAGPMTAPDGKGAFRIVPAKTLPAFWLPRPFAPDARVTGIAAGLDAAVRMTRQALPVFGSTETGKDLGDAYAGWKRREENARAALPDDVADLPLNEIAPSNGNTHRIAIILTGDGGWAGLDKGVAAALSGHGVRVVGFSTLKFFWHRKTPDEAAAAVARVITHYGKAHPGARFVLIGYSFGAGLVPVVINRLPAALAADIDGGVLISPDPDAVFEIHVGDWFGSTHHADALPLAPEIAKSTVPLVCVKGADENDSFCPGVAGPHLRVVELPGGHHYNGDYAALGALIAKNLPSKAGSAPM